MSVRNWLAMEVHENIQLDQTQKKLIRLCGDIRKKLRVDPAPLGTLCLCVSVSSPFYLCTPPTPTEMQFQQRQRPHPEPEATAARSTPKGFASEDFPQLQELPGSSSWSFHPTQPTGCNPSIPHSTAPVWPATVWTSAAPQQRSQRPLVPRHGLYLPQLPPPQPHLEDQIRHWMARSHERNS